MPLRIHPLTAPSIGTIVRILVDPTAAPLPHGDIHVLPPCTQSSTRLRIPPDFSSATSGAPDASTRRRDAS